MNREITILRSHELDGGQKIWAIKSLRTATNMGLKEAKEAIECLPTPFTVRVDPLLNFDDVVRELREKFIIETEEGRQEVSARSIESAFKHFLIALIEAGEYDEVIRFINVKKHENKGRRLEPV